MEINYTDILYQSREQTLIWNNEYEALLPWTFSICNFSVSVLSDRIKIPSPANIYIFFCGEDLYACIPWNLFYCVSHQAMTALPATALYKEGYNKEMAQRWIKQEFNENNLWDNIHLTNITCSIHNQCGPLTPFRTCCICTQNNNIFPENATTAARSWQWNRDRYRYVCPQSRLTVLQSLIIPEHICIDVYFK